MGEARGAGGDDGAAVLARGETKGGARGARPRAAAKSEQRQGVHRIGLYPGTFDPITNGHLDIIARAAKLVDRLVIGVAINEDKRPLFKLPDRVAMVEAECKRLALTCDLAVEPFDKLLMQFAQDVRANVIVRGLRAVSDFEYEFQMVGMNQKLNPAIETVFLMADPTCQAIASRLVKEIARLGGEVSQFVPPAVVKRLAEAFKKGA